MSNARFTTLYGPSGTQTSPNLMQGTGASVDTSAGAADAGKIPCLDSTGALSPTFFPASVGETTITATAGETIPANSLVNLTNTGVRLADASSSRPADGFVTSAIANGAAGQVYLSGKITGLTGLTGGTTLFLSTAGALSATPASSGIWQAVARAINATSAEFVRGEPVGL